MNYLSGLYISYLAYISDLTIPLFPPTLKLQITIVPGLYQTSGDPKA